MVVAALTSVTPAAAAAPAPPPTVGQAAAAALVAAAAPHAMLDPAGGGTGCTAGGADPVAYRTDRLVLRGWLTPTQAADRVRAALRDLGHELPVTEVELIHPPAPVGQPEVAPVAVVHLDTPEGTPAGGAEPPPIVAAARRLRATGTAASPDYLLSPTSGPTAMWPGGPPEPATEPVAVRAAGTGAGVQVLVYDAGLPPPDQSAHPPNLSRLRQADVEHLDQQAPFGVVDNYFAGHTVAIADVIHTLAPGAVVKVARITGTDGVPTDALAAERMATSLREARDQGVWPDLIVNAFGSTSCDGLAPLGLAAVTEAIDRQDRALVVASAGNRGESRPFYPAAFAEPSVVAVGALDLTGQQSGQTGAWSHPSRTGPAAAFSNRGPWVDAWAPGVDLVTRHVDGFRFAPDGPVITGLASVDGTSYAAPYLVGLIAEEMAASGVDPATAWARVAAAGTPCAGALGGGVAVALAGWDRAAVDVADPAEPARC